MSLPVFGNIGQQKKDCTQPLRTPPLGVGSRCFRKGSTKGKPTKEGQEAESPRLLTVGRKPIYPVVKVPPTLSLCEQGDLKDVKPIMVWYKNCGSQKKP